MGNDADKEIRKVVGIVVEPYEEQRASGLAYATLEEVRGLQDSMTDVDFLLYSHNPVRPERIGRRARWVGVPKSFIGKNLWFLWAIFARRNDVADVLLFNMPLLPFVFPRRVTVLPIAYETVFYSRDASFKKNIGNKLRALLGGWALARARTIVIPSRATGFDLCKAYRGLEKKLTYIPLGYRRFASLDVSGVPTQPFFLYVGAVKHKKNVHRMLEAFCNFKDALHTNHKFALAGKSGGEYTENLKTYAMSRGYADDVLFLGYMYGEQLGGLYAKAEALLFCTLQEGFGMPIIEAMAVGTPVITSNISSQDEVGGEAAVRVNPEQPRDITSAMLRIVQDVPYRKEHIRLGKLHAEQFSWDRHCTSLAAVIRSFF